MTGEEAGMIQKWLERLERSVDKLGDKVESLDEKVDTFVPRQEIVQMIEAPIEQRRLDRRRYLQALSAFIAVFLALPASITAGVQVYHVVEPARVTPSATATLTTPGAR